MSHCFVSLPECMYINLYSNTCIKLLMMKFWTCFGSTFLLFPSTSTIHKLHFQQFTWPPTRPRGSKDLCWANDHATTTSNRSTAALGTARCDALAPETKLRNKLNKNLSPMFRIGSNTKTQKHYVYCMGWVDPLPNHSG